VVGLSWGLCIDRLRESWVKKLDGWFSNSSATVHGVWEMDRAGCKAKWPEEGRA
jgi:hypothetical protein